MHVSLRRFSVGGLHFKWKKKKTKTKTRPLTETATVPWVGGLGSGGAEGGPTCPIFHVLHLHDFRVDPTPEDVEGAIDGFGPLGGFLPPGDPERQWEVVPFASPHGAAAAFNRAT